MAKTPDIRVVVGAERVQTESTIAYDLKHVAKQISDSNRIPHIKVGIDVNASRSLFEKQLKEVTKGLNAKVTADVATPTIGLNTSSLIDSVNRAIGAIGDLKAVSTAASKTPIVSAERKKEIQQMTDASVQLQANIVKAHRELGDLISGRKISQKSAIGYIQKLSEENANAFAWADNLDSAEEKYYNAYKKRISQAEDYKRVLDQIAEREKFWGSTMGSAVLGGLKTSKGASRTLMKGISAVDFIPAGKIDSEQKAFDSVNVTLDEHTAQMQNAVEAESAKAAQSVKTANALQVEEDAFDEAANASEEHAKIIKVNAQSNIREFERQVAEQAKMRKHLEGFELESVTAQRDQDDNITGMRLTYNNPKTGAVYQADYVAKALEEDLEDAGRAIDDVNDKTIVLNGGMIELEQVSSRIVKHQKDIAAELRKNVGYRDKQSNTLLKRSESLYRESLDPNAKKSIFGDDRASLEADYAVIQRRIEAFRQSTLSMEGLKQETIELNRLLDQYENKMKSSQNAQYAATQLAARSLETNRKIQEQNLETWRSNFRNAGFDSGEAWDELSKLDVNTIVDSESLRKFLDQLDVLKAKLKSLKAEQKKKTSDNRWLTGRLQAIQGINYGAVSGKSKLVDASHVDEYTSQYNLLEKEIREAIEASKVLTTEEKAGIQARITALRAYVREAQKAEKFDVADVNLDVYQNKYDLLKKASKGLSPTAAGDGAFDAQIDDLHERLTALRTAVAAYQSDFNEGLPDEVIRQDIEQVQKLEKEFNDAYDAANRFLRVAKSSDVNAGRNSKAYNDIQALWQQVLNFEEMNDKFKLDSDLLSRYQTLRDQIEPLSKLKITDSFDPAMIKKLSGDFKAFVNHVKQSGKAGKSFFAQLRDQLAKLGVYLTGSAVWNALNQAMRQMVQNVIELDAAMTELKKVTDETNAAYDRFLLNATDRAGRLGAKLSDVVTATADFARLGYTISEASALSDAAIVYKNVGDGIQDISAASESIISTMKAFGIAADDAMTIVDKFNEVGNTMPISSKGIGDALQRSASSLAAAGNSLDESIALIVAGNAVLQDPDVVGTALKTISMRLQKTSGELEELGEDAAGAAESVTQLQTKLLNLTGGRVNIMEDDSSFKSTYQILTELAGVWTTLTETQKSSATELIAGIRQGNAMNAILTNMSMASQAVTTSLESSGSALAENEKQLQSINGRITLFNAEWEELSAKTIDSDWIKGFVDFGTGVLAWVNELGGLLPILTTVLGLFAAKNMTSITKSFSSMVGTFRAGLKGVKTDSTGLIHTIGSLVRVFQHGMTKGRSFGHSLKVLAKTGALTNIALGAVTLGVTAVVSAVQYAIQKTREARQEAINSAESLKDSIDTIEEYKTQIQELGDALKYGNLSEQEAYDKREQLLSIQDQIIEKYGTEAGAIRLLTDETNESIAKLDELIVKQAEAWDAAKVLEVNDARKSFSNSTTLFGSIVVATEGATDILEKFGAVSNQIDSITTEWSHSSATTIEEIEWLTNLSTEFAKYGDQYDDVRAHISKLINTLQTDDYEENLELVQKDFENQLIIDQQYRDFYESITAAQERYNQAVADQNASKQSSALQDLYDLMQKIDDVADDALDEHFFTELFAGQIADINLDQFQKAVESNLNGVQDTIKTAFDRIESEIGEFDTLTLTGTIESFDNFTDSSETAAGVKTLVGLCDEYKISVDDLVNSLRTLGMVQGEAIQSYDNSDNYNAERVRKITDALKTHSAKMNEINRLVAEENEKGFISEDTFNRLTASGSDLIDVLETAYDELGNPIGFKLSADAAESYTDELRKSTTEVFKANNATADYYLALDTLARDIDDINKDIATYSGEVDELTEAYEKVLEKEQFSYTEMLKLSEAYPDLSFAIDEATGKYNLELDSLKKVVQGHLELIKALQEEKLATVELNGQQMLLDSHKGWSTAQAKQNAARFKRYIDENDITSFKEYLDWVGVDEITNEGTRQYIETYIAARNGVKKAQDEIDAWADKWEEISQQNVEKRQKEDTSDTVFERLKKQLDMERDAYEAGRELADEYRQFNLDSEEKYWDEYERIVEEGHKRGDIKDDVDYQNYLTEIFEGRKALLEESNQDTYESRKEQLDLEREALEAGYKLDKQYQKYGIESEREYWETLQKFAKEALNKGEIDAKTYASVLIEAYTALRDLASQDYADELTKLETEKKKIEAGIVWDTSILADLTDFYDKYEKLNEKRFKENLITAEEYVDGLISIFEYEKSQLQDTLSGFEHDNSLMQNQIDSGRYSGADVAKNRASIISNLEMMQELVHQAAEVYREEMSGVMSDLAIEHSDFIKELQNQWWDYQREIDRINQEIFSDALDSYKTYINNCNKFSIWRSDNEVDASQRALDFLESSYERDLITYEQYLTEKIDLLGSMYDAEKARQQAYVDEVIRIMEKEREALEEELAQYEEQKENYETAVSTVVDYIDERIQALRDENEELDKQLQMQNALEEIERARAQRTRRVYVEGVGFEWMADEDAVKGAQESYDELKKEAELEDQIEALEAYKKAWQNTVDSYEKNQNELITAQILGNQWQQVLSNEMLAIVTRGSEGINYVREIEYTKLVGYSNSYKAICDQLDEKVEGSVAHQIEQLDKLIDQWGDVLEDIERETSQYQDVLDKAKEFERLNYTERGAMLDTFKSNSVANLKAIQDEAAAATQALAALQAAQAEQAIPQLSPEELMYKNSVQWWHADEEERADLSAQNLLLGAQLGWTRDEASGLWYDKDGNVAYVIPEYLKKKQEFSNGGVVDYTGLATVHGSQAKAETVFNSADSAKLYEYVHSVPNLVQDFVDRLNWNPNLKRNNSTVEIREIHLHDVQNVDGLADAIVRTLPLKLAQKMAK